MSNQYTLTIRTSLDILILTLNAAAITKEQVKVQSQSLIYISSNSRMLSEINTP
ncbi:hypothetical protein Hanom_Chr01g00063381 [Helianthus anomalus]